MKKISILSIVLLVVFGSFFSCKVKDDKAPKIFFSSDVETSLDWVLQEYYTLPQATASDNVDGDLTSSIKLTNNLVFYELRTGQTIYECENKIKNGTEGYIGKAGKYAVVYNVTDAAGNVGSKTLNINVLNTLNNWSVNSSEVKINYLIKRKYLAGDQQRIGGVYTVATNEDEYSYEDGYSNVDGKPVTTTFSPDKTHNYRLKISKICNISKLSLLVDFNRFNRMVSFVDFESPIVQEMAKINGTGNYIMTDFVYDVNQSDLGLNQYDPTTQSFTITYQVERWKEDPNGSKEVEGRTWKSDRKCTYQETYVPE